MPECPTCGRALKFAPDGSQFCPVCQPEPQLARPPRPTLKQYLVRFPVTFGLIGANVAVYLAMVASHVSPTSPTTAQLLRWGADSGEKVLLGHQWWRVVTGAFVHIGIVHIGMNMWALWVLGALSEAVLGPYLYLGIYFVCTIAASLTSLYWHPIAVGAGASGAIMGILGAMVSVLKLGRLPLPAPVLRSTMRSLVQGALLTLVIGIYGSIDNAAHLGGLACGLIIGFFLSLTRRADQQSQPLLRRLCILIPLALMAPYAVAVKRHSEPIALLVRALDQIQNSQYAQAEKEVREVLKSRPSDPDALGVLSEALMDQNRDAEAVPYLQALLTQDPSSEFAADNLANIELNAGNAVAARDLLTKTLPSQPKNALGQVYLGQALEQLKQDDQAIAQYRKAVEMDPKLYQAQMALGEIYEKHNDPRHAIWFYDTAAQLHPNEADPLLGLARNYKALGLNQQEQQVIAKIQTLQKHQSQSPSEK
ncbi:MAG TPA: rhomboid family intramembrane serine protease [Terriglobales bacterium]|nr:rhomboid family intramembrane serine protease [Terriglobales bacterium]